MQGDSHWREIWTDTNDPRDRREAAWIDPNKRGSVENGRLWRLALATARRTWCVVSKAQPRHRHECLDPTKNGLERSPPVSKGVPGSFQLFSPFPSNRRAGAVPPRSVFLDGWTSRGDLIGRASPVDVINFRSNRVMDSDFLMSSNNCRRGQGRAGSVLRVLWSCSEHENVIISSRLEQKCC
eukprot:scaffold938_cov334-Pavlova_lutheri.AAC.81